MSKVFISYSHNDKVKIQDVVRQIKNAGHDVWIDESKLLVSDPITVDIQENIRNSDYVIVFLSPHSVESTWVRQEIYETLYQELHNRKIKLLPCLIEDCELPKAFTKTKKFSRIYENFLINAKESVANILSILDESAREVFRDEHYAVLHIPFPGLEIYLAGETYGWHKNDEMKYFETVDSYLLFGFSIDPFKNFKHFVLCEEKDADSIKGKLKSLAYTVTGAGDTDPETNKRRIWFNVKPGIEFSNYSFRISEDNNQWIENA